jgi:hypothetical protein
MVEPSGTSPLEVLTLLGDGRSMEPLLDALRGAGCRVDVARDVASARALFFGSGGHDCLVVGPDVPPGVAKQVLASLRGVDPALATASFGPALRRFEAPTRTAHLAAFHPTSRAATGALLRFLRNLARR